MSIDARFFYVEWKSLNQLDENFWEKWADSERELKPESNEWIAEETQFKDSLPFWKTAWCASNAYEEIRMKLPISAREKTDTIIASLFANSACDYWEEFEEEEKPYLETIGKADFNYGISPEIRDQVLSLWNSEIAAELSKVFPERREAKYITNFDFFISYINGWIDVLEKAKEKGAWGILIQLSY